MARRVAALFTWLHELAPLAVAPMALRAVITLFLVSSTAASPLLGGRRHDMLEAVAQRVKLKFFI